MFYGELCAQKADMIVIHCNKKGADIQPTMYGHFFEDINFAADGGLYAELIKNRSFEFPQNLRDGKFLEMSLYSMMDLLGITRIMFAWETQTCS